MAWMCNDCSDARRDSDVRGELLQERPAARLSRRTAQPGVTAQATTIFSAMTAVSGKAREGELPADQNYGRKRFPNIIQPIDARAPKSLRRAKQIHGSHLAPTMRPNIYRP